MSSIFLSGPNHLLYNTAHARFNGEFIFGEFKFGHFKSDRQIVKFKSSPNFPDIRYAFLYLAVLL